MRTVRFMKEIAACAAIVVLCSGPGEARGQGTPISEASHPGSESEMARFFTGSEPYRVDIFPGKLVCLRCNLAHTPGAAAQCAKEGHRHALMLDGGSMVHPLLVTDEQTLERINSAELHGKNVKVQGRYYPSIGSILVIGITPGD